MDINIDKALYRIKVISLREKMTDLEEFTYKEIIDNAFNLIYFCIDTDTVEFKCISNLCAEYKEKNVKTLMTYKEWKKAFEDILYQFDILVPIRKISRFYVEKRDILLESKKLPYRAVARELKMDEKTDEEEWENLLNKYKTKFCMKGYMKAFIKQFIIVKRVKGI